MTKDLLNSIKAHLYDRATSPLFGTFAVSWLIWNYRFLMVFFSSMPVDEKIDYIYYFIYPNAETTIWVGVVFPVLTAAAFIFLYPYPAKIVYEYTRNRQKELKEIKQRIEDETPLTKEESRQIRREIYSLESEHDIQIARKDTEIEDLKRILEELRKENDDLKRQVASVDEEKTGNKMRFMSPKDKKAAEIEERLKHAVGVLADNDGKLPVSIMKEILELPKIEYDYIIRELADRDLVRSHLDQDTLEDVYELTHRGRKMAINSEL